MRINPEHADQLAWIIREVDETNRLTAPQLAEAILSHPGSMWQPAVALAQPQGDGLTDDEALRRGRSAIEAALPLPPNYIDLEYQGEDRELLQTFYRACQTEGGTADEIHLRGIRAVLAARPAAPAQPEPGEAPAAWLYKGDSDFDGTTWRENWDVTTDEQLARFKASPGCPVPLFRSAAPPAPDPGEVAELVGQLKADAQCVAAGQSDLMELTDKQLIRAATLLQQQQARIAGLRSALADCGRAVGASISDDCSDGFLLEVPAEVRLAVVKTTPAVVPVAVSERLPDPRPESEGGDCGHGLPGAAIRGGASWFTPEEMEEIEAMEAHHAILLPQSEEVQS